AGSCLRRSRSSCKRDRWVGRFTMSGRLHKVVHRGLVVGTFMAVLAAPIAEAAAPEIQIIGNAANDSRNAEEAPPQVLGPMSAAEEEGYGCLVAGGAALALTAV